MSIPVPPPPPPQGPPPQGGSKVPLLVGIAIAALLVVGGGVTALVLVLSGSQSPEDAVSELYDATIEADCEVLVTHPVTELDSVEECEDQETAAREAAEEQGDDYDSFDIEVERIDVIDESDDGAVLLVDVVQNYTADGEDETNEFTLEYQLLKDGDRWAVVTEKDVTSDPES